MTNAENQSKRGLAAVILAAGKGTRMQSDLPKVMHEVGDRPMVHWVVDAVRSSPLEASPVAVVVGFKRETVEDSFTPRPDWMQFPVQAEQLGTGHAIDMASPLFQDEALAKNTDVMVLCGDGPLIRTETLAMMLERHVSTGADATLADKNGDTALMLACANEQEAAAGELMEATKRAGALDLQVGHEAWVLRACVV